MLSSAEMTVVETLGSPKRLNNSSVTSAMRWAVRRGGFLAMACRQALDEPPAGRRALRVGPGALVSGGTVLLDGLGADFRAAGFWRAV